MAAPTRLVGDIGGTNARFALLDDDRLPIEPVTYRCDEFASLVDAIAAFLQASGSDKQLQSAAIAVATPVVGDQIKLTNNSWSFSIDSVKASLGLDTLHVVNDFTALALSVPHLREDEREQVGSGIPQDRHSVAVIGPGTGLGVSGLVPCGEHWSALQGEGGHVTLTGSTQRELAVQAVLASRWSHVSAERFLSGPGLVNIATALREIDGLESKHYAPEDITRLGISGEDPVCAETLGHFCRLLGACAGNLVLSLGAEGGCYIGGGIVPRLGAFFGESDFRRAFEAKGRMQHYLENIPTYIIRSPYPALLGAAQMLD
jgi:glucokinase